MPLGVGGNCNNHRCHSHRNCQKSAHTSNHHHHQQQQQPPIITPKTKQQQQHLRQPRQSLRRQHTSSRLIEQNNRRTKSISHLRHQQQQQQHQIDHKQDLLQDLPTVYIAPDDYQHIYHKQTGQQQQPPPPPLLPPPPPTPPPILNNDPVDAVDNLPTVYIAPDDYIHIYKRQPQTQSQQQQQQQSQPPPTPSPIINNDQVDAVDNLPTVYIAPDDYVHIYKRQPQQQTQQQQSSQQQQQNESRKRSSSTVKLFNRHLPKPIQPKTQASPPPPLPLLQPPLSHQRLMRFFSIIDNYDINDDYDNQHHQQHQHQYLNYHRETEQLFKCYPRCPSLCNNHNSSGSSNLRLRCLRQKPACIVPPQSLTQQQQHLPTSMIPIRLIDAIRKFISTQK